MPNAAGSPPFREGAGRLCLDYLRTLRFAGSSREVEELTDPSALSAWIAQFAPGGAAPPTVPTAAQVEEARLLREAVRSVLGAARPTRVDAPGLPDPAALQQARGRINAAAARPPAAPSLDGSNAVCWDAGDGITTMLSMIARDAIDLVSSTDLPRIRNCANPDCGALFLDGSRPGTRRWCSMNRCGNLAKKEAMRHRAGRT